MDMITDIPTYACEICTHKNWNSVQSQNFGRTLELIAPDEERAALLKHPTEPVADGFLTLWLGLGTLCMNT